MDRATLESERAKRVSDAELAEVKTKVAEAALAAGSNGWDSRFDLVWKAYPRSEVVATLGQFGQILDLALRAEGYRKALGEQRSAWQALAKIAAEANPSIPGSVVHQIARAGQLACAAALGAQATEIPALREALAVRDRQWAAMPAEWRKEVRERVRRLDAGEEGVPSLGALEETR